MMVKHAACWMGWILGIAGATSALATEPDDSAPSNLAEWSLHCFCITAVRTPHSAITMDNNGTILHRARSGVTRDELAREGIAVTDSQIALLQLMHALEVDDDVLRTAFPVIGPEQLDSLRPRLRQLAEAVLPDIEPHVAAIRARLHDEGLSRSEYAVVFGHAVDGVLWERLRERGALPSTELSVEYPLWRGALWALYPSRGNVAGVNEHRAGQATLILNWTRPTGRALRSLDTSLGLPDALQRLATGQKIAPVIDVSGRTWTLIDDSGMQIPVIHVRDDDPLHAPALGIATVLANALDRDGEMAEVLTSIEGVDRKQALVIAAHEFIWDVMDLLVERGLIERPAVLDDPSAETDDLRALLVLRVNEGETRAKQGP
ncbi:hypothetical protein [Marilutibacter alkalisoli]|uniref:Uncharacterized protein n=1 Tax=Marilutibacter alkalisoli TaxID=2591633 RepID=A0A514BVS8_9GAMM|nr:hypothetical protein [Lysobacter alkalisoli]QDH71477.1 hypothetical protein FKV23_16305 [Lysobacter alkalisoli]